MNDTVGNELTVTITFGEIFVQPYTLVTFTLYVPETVAVYDELVALGTLTLFFFHRYERFRPVLPFNSTLPPAQNVVGEAGVTVAEGVLRMVAWMVFETTVQP